MVGISFSRNLHLDLRQKENFQTWFSFRNIFHESISIDVKEDIL